MTVAELQAMLDRLPDDIPVLERDDRGRLLYDPDMPRLIRMFKACMTPPNDHFDVTQDGRSRGTPGTVAELYALLEGLPAGMRILARNDLGHFLTAL